MRGLITHILKEYILESYKWNEENLRKEALKYKTRTEFRQKMPGAVDAARKIGSDFYNEITSHMPKVAKRKHSEESLRQEAKKYKRRKEFFDNSQGAYLAAKRISDDFFNDITSHMEDGRAFQEVKWTDEILKKITSEYDKLSDFRNENPQAYLALLRRGDEKYNEYTNHMEKRRTPFTDDELKDIALKYTNASSFQKNDGSAYVASKNRGKDFFDEITKHFQRLSREPYTYDEVKKLALKYNTITDFQKNDRGAYSAAKNNNWIDDVTSHMIETRHNWSFDEVKDIASRYPTKKEWRDGNSKSYSWALSNLSPTEYDEVTTHMEPLGNIEKRLIYSFEFPDNSVYVGLTFNSKKRIKQHLNSIKSAVNKHILKTGLKPTFKKHTEYISKEDAMKMEGKIEDYYKKNGWKILNRTKTGALGSSILKWTYEEVQKEALKYKTRSEFETNSGSAYNSARANGWLDDVTKHMTLLKNYKYTYNQLKDITQKYDSLKDFRKNDNGAYQSAKSQGWFNELTSHMSKGGKRGSIWDNFNKVKQEALKYNNSRDFRKYSSGAYKSAFRNGWYNEISKHFQYKKKWTLDNLKKEALKYDNLKDFRVKSNGAYQTAFKSGILNDITKHITK